MKKSKRPKTSKREDEVDFIGNMSDAILLLILSRLYYTEEVVRTSILSTRWRHLWTSIPSLNLCYGYKGKFRKSKFKEFVYWVLLNKSVDLHHFCLNCCHYYNMSIVGRWIRTTIMRNNKQLSLLIFPKKNTGDIEMPHCLMTCGSLEDLTLDLVGFGIRLPNFMGFPALKVLDLTCVDLLEDDDLVKDFLRRCSLLEDLRFTDCVITKLDLLCISCPKLKSLKFDNLPKVDLCGGIKICCPKLVKLFLSGPIVSNYFFEGLNCLKEAVIEPEIDLQHRIVVS